MELRPYQARAFQEIKDELKQGFHDFCVEMPTGSGKSHVIAYMCKSFLQNYPHLRILMLTHVKELIEQNYEKMTQYWPNAPCGVYSASVGKRNLEEPITFAGVQSLVNKLDQFEDVNLIIIDECHLVSHKDEGSYRNIINTLRDRNPKMRVIGLTATPYRLGHGYIDEGEHAIFSKIIRPVTVYELIEQGFLSTLKTKCPKQLIDTDGVKKSGGEFIQKELALAVSSEDLNETIVDEIILRAQDRKSWLIFCVGVNHSEQVKEILLKKGIWTEVVTGETPKGERRRIIQEFKAGKIKALVNANVLTTGFDAPNVDLIAVLRPTLSTALHVQILGRGLRLKEHTDHCLVLDFAGNIAKHGGIAEPKVKSTKPQEEENKRQMPTGDNIKVCPACDEIVSSLVRTCPECGHIFAELELDTNHCAISGFEIDEKIYEINVSDWKWSKHVSKTSGKDVLKLTYYGGLSDTPINEYFPVAHGGQAQNLAFKKLTDIFENAGVSFNVAFKSDDIEEMIRYLNLVSKKPSIIKYVRDGKWFKVKDRVW